MTCDHVREAISASLDGAAPCMPASAVEAHLAGCAGCRAWREAAHALTRHARLGGHVLNYDLTAAVLAAADALPSLPSRGWRLRTWTVPRARRAALAAVALAQFAITVPLLVLGRDPVAGEHAAHELGSFALALAIAFAVGAIRPALSAGLAWPCGIAATGLALTAIADVLGGGDVRRRRSTAPGSGGRGRVAALPGPCHSRRRRGGGHSGTAAIAGTTGRSAGHAADHAGQRGTSPPRARPCRTSRR
ncbi:MAG TPA: zf-HC2 domain-containing protein [Streptosporangiaceae bacterium]|jgi:predicted anti-sigma-YlaC factor YlaD